MHAVEPMAGTPAYATSKHALRGWSTSCYAVRSSFLHPQWFCYSVPACWLVPRKQHLYQILWSSNSAAPRKMIIACLFDTKCCLQALRNDNIKVVLINPAAVRTGGCLL